MHAHLHRRIFDPLDLEIINRVYEAVWAKLEVREPFRDQAQDDERKNALRRLIIDDTEPGLIEFDALYERVIADMPRAFPMFTAPKRA